ncbi:MAG: hypothetical protein QNL91_06675 [Candidatus Krumholzibacteria bacterium]|nr:hypothetical protein [Candidatus Krumholzibacteria bacterium]
MVTRKSLLMLISLVVLLAMPVVAAGGLDASASESVDPPQNSEGSVIRVFSLIDLPLEKVEHLAPLQKQLRQILLAQKDSLAPLYAEFAEETDSLLGLEIQKRIQKVKIETELSLLRAQADHARRNGQADLAEKIEAGLLRMTEREQARQDNSWDPSARPIEPGAQN